MGRIKSFYNKFVTRYWFLTPALVIYCTFIIYPMIQSFYVSLHKWDGISPGMEFIGIRNYVKFFTNPAAIQVLIRTLLWTVAGVLLPTLFGLLLAIALNRSFRGRTLFRAVFYSPYILPLVALGIVWSWIYNPMFGALNEFLKMVGLGSLTTAWLSQPHTAFASLIATNVWRATGYPMILFLAGLQGIDKQLYEAAWIDGANYLQSFWHITLPQLRETFIIVGALLVIGSLKSFQLIYTMTWGGPGGSTQVLGIYMYFNTFLHNNAGYGSAVAWIMTIMSLAIAFPYIHFLTKGSEKNA